MLYERVAPIVNRIVWSYLATDAERDDIAQDVFVAIVRKAHSVRHLERIEAWAARVAVNVIYNAFRARKIRRFLSLEDLNEPTPEVVPADFEGRELLIRIQRILERMPVRERMPFTLQLLGGSSIDEIADLCGYSQRTARRRIKAGEARFWTLVRQDPALRNAIESSRNEVDDE